MRLIIDKHPKESSDCLFCEIRQEGQFGNECFMNGSFIKFCKINNHECILEDGKCSLLKEYKPNKVNVKISRKRDKK